MPNPNFVLYLPSEILALIINKLASDDDETLAALASCRLASHVLCSLATPLFFSSIQLTEFPSPHDLTDCSRLVKRATRLNQILSIRHIATSVQALTLRCYLPNLQNSTNSTLISSILHRLPHVRNFALEALGTVGRWPDFSSIPEDFASAVQAFCRSPNLTTLYLHNICGFPFTIIAACPNLRCLRLCDAGLSFDNVISREETSSPQFLYLDSLEIDMESIAALGSRSTEDISIAKLFSRIKNLQLKNLFCHASILHYGWDIMLLASQALTTLDLPIADDEFYRELPKDTLSFDWSRLPALRYFKIQWRSSCLDGLGQLPFLTQLLSSSSSSTGIETLEIEITWVSVRVGTDLFLSDAGWSKLDRILSSETFVFLTKVVLRLSLEMAMSWRATARYYFNDSDQPFSKSARNLILPYVNDLFPLFRASTQRTLEMHFEVDGYQ